MGKKINQTKILHNCDDRKVVSENAILAQKLSRIAKRKKITHTGDTQHPNVCI